MPTEVDRLLRMLESLTPGGSEYHNDPERCVEYMRARLKGAVQQALRRKAAEAECDALREALRWLLHLHHGISKGGVDQETGARYPVTDAEWHDALEAARAALERDKPEVMT